MISWLRRNAKRKLDLLKDWQVSPPKKVMELLLQQEQIYRELPYAALLQLIDIVKGFLDSFTRYKTREHIARDADQFLYGIKNIGWGLFHLIMLPAYYASAMKSIYSHIKNREPIRALATIGHVIATTVGLLLNSAASLVRGLLQVIGSPLNQITLSARYVLTYEVLKAEKTFQENNGTQRVVNEGVKILKKNGKGSQGEMLALLTEASRKLKKAQDRKQPLQHKDKLALFDFDKEVQNIKLDKNQDLALRLNDNQFRASQALLNWLVPESKPILDLSYNIPTPVR